MHRMSPKIMVVEDEEALCFLLRYNLEAEGYDVQIIADGEEASLALLENVPDLVLLDWMLPGVSGLELCRRIRARSQTETLPIIMLTARGEESEKIRGLAVGADDYIVKPFSTRELVARIRALLRRAKPALLSSTLRFAGIELDRDSRRVHRDGHEIKLGPTEFRLLDFLIAAPGRVFSRERLLDAVWGQNLYVDERTVDVHIGRLRKALNILSKPDVIRTVRGAGYAIDASAIDRLKEALPSEKV
ncbi:hypothetical protein N185_37375 [Sinorhizobium sp. GW3]|nr:hypothetical protein N185_37375 [Sinorhizobium sp. GW3]